MKESRDAIENIIATIETGRVDTGDTYLSADALIGKLLGRRNNEENSCSPDPVFAEVTKQVSEINKPERWNCDFYRPISSGGGFRGKIALFIKKCIRKIIAPVMKPIVADQVNFNAESVRTINALLAYINSINSEVSDSKKADLQGQVNQVSQKMSGLEEKLEKLAGSDDVYDVIDYDRFEQNFRGSEAEVKEKFKEYLPYLKGKNKVVDLGCGRGELLELLGENGISALGVDTYDKFVRECKEKGLSVINADALEYMESIPDESVDGIVAFQLVEHLKPAELVRLCQVSYRKLMKGGILIFETPNPTCLSVYTNSFYLDMTHEKPVHPLTLKYILRESGFEDVSVLFTEGSKIKYRLPLLDLAGVDNLAEYNDGINGLSDLIWGSQDYAVIATK